MCVCVCSFLVISVYFPLASTHPFSLETSHTPAHDCCTKLCFVRVLINCRSWDTVVVVYVNECARVSVKNDLFLNHALCSSFSIITSCNDGTFSFVSVQWECCRCGTWAWAKTAHAVPGGGSHNSFIWQVRWLTHPSLQLIMFVSLSTLVDNWWQKGKILKLMTAVCSAICRTQKYLESVVVFYPSLRRKTASPRREMWHGPFSQLSFLSEAQNRT